MIPVRLNESNDIVSNKYLCVNSCGINRVFGIETGSVRPNGRRDYHIIYVLNGNCYVEVDGEFVRADAGSMILYYPGVPQHYKYSKDDDTTSCYLHFSGIGCEELLDEFGFSKDVRIYNLGIIPGAESIFRRLKFEQTQKKLFYEQRSSSLLLELLALFGRSLSESAIYSDNSYVSRIDKICKIMLDDNESWHNMEYYAEQCFLSVSRFEHVFREVTGMSPNKYLMNLRINKAKDLLAETDMSVADVSIFLGFSSQSYFIRIFKKYTGQTPLKYKVGQFSRDDHVINKFYRELK